MEALQQFITIAKVQDRSTCRYLWCLCSLHTCLVSYSLPLTLAVVQLHISQFVSDQRYILHLPPPPFPVSTLLSTLSSLCPSPSPRLCILFSSSSSSTTYCVLPSLPSSISLFLPSSTPLCLLPSYVPPRHSSSSLLPSPSALHRLLQLQVGDGHCRHYFSRDRSRSHPIDFLLL